jgi:hypothetical protein
MKRVAIAQFFSAVKTLTILFRNRFNFLIRYYIISDVSWVSGGELLELRLLDTHLLDTFGSKSIARHKICHLLESS